MRNIIVFASICALSFSAVACDRIKEPLAVPVPTELDEKNEPEQRTRVSTTEVTSATIATTGDADEAKAAPAIEPQPAKQPEPATAPAPIPGN